jgi:Ni,Fe-hydrogenase III large subunit
MTEPRDASAKDWTRATRRLAAGEATLVSLWGDAGCVRMALHERERAELSILTMPCPDGAFPSVGAVHPPAIRLERAIADLFGYRATGAPDARPWLDHGRWPIGAPLGAASPNHAPAAPYAFLSAEGPGLHQIPVGPVHAGIIEPGHFRFHASGETVVRLEARLGYAHKGVNMLMRGATLERGALLAARISGDSTVAYQFAFARAAEAALGIEAPARARWLRAALVELERLANHLGDIGAICNDASFSLMHAHCGILRERVLRACGATFDHRLMMDTIVPGGVAVDLTPTGSEAIRAVTANIREVLPRLITLYDNTASLQDRTVRTGVLRKALAVEYGCGGYIGRASGRDFDSRRAIPYSPYDELLFAVPLLADGDVNARVWIRIREVEQSLEILEQILGRLPSGPLRDEIAASDRAVASGGESEGHALVEGFRGDVFVALRLAPDGLIANAHLRDPSWFQWPLLEAAIEGNIVADFPLCNKSFNCSYSGCDL